MATTVTTVTLEATQAANSNLPRITRLQYPDKRWSSTLMNYFRDADMPPPDCSNSLLSEHEMRIQRRSDESPHINPTPVRVRNIRGEENLYSIATHGFKIARLQTKMQDWHNLSEREVVYFTEISDLLKQELGAKHVFCFEHHVRSHSLEDALKEDSKGEVDINGPVRRVHIDQSPADARNEFAYWVLSKPENVHLRGHEFGIYNVWKPLETVYKDPLALCNSQTIALEDLQKSKVFVPGPGEIENIQIRAPQVADRHEFCYLREQAVDEALLFRIFDSRIDEGGHDGVGNMCQDRKMCHGVAHSSFVDPGTENCSPRASVEVRSFCVF